MKKKLLWIFLLYLFFIYTNSAYAEPLPPPITAPSIIPTQCIPVAYLKRDKDLHIVCKKTDANLNTMMNGKEFQRLMKFVRLTWVKNAPKITWIEINSEKSLISVKVSQNGHIAAEGRGLSVQYAVHDLHIVSHASK